MCGQVVTGKEGKTNKGGGDNCVGKVVMYVCMSVYMYVCMYVCM